MTINSVFQGRSLLAEKDFTPAEIQYLVDFGLHLKALQQQNIPHHYLEGKNIALLFEKTSTRTRSAFTTAAIELGAHPEYLGAKEKTENLSILETELQSFSDDMLPRDKTIAGSND